MSLILILRYDILIHLGLVFFSKIHTIFNPNFYQYIVRDPSGINKENYTLASLGVASKSYLRGYDFTEQMSYFLSFQKDWQFSASSAVIVDNILNQLRDQINCLS